MACKEVQHRGVMLFFIGGEEGVQKASAGFAPDSNDVPCIANAAIVLSDGLPDHARDFFRREFIADIVVSLKESEWLDGVCYGYHYDAIPTYWEGSKIQPVVYATKYIACHEAIDASSGWKAFIEAICKFGHTMNNFYLSE